MVTKSGWVVFEEDFGVTRYGSKAEELCVVVSHAYVFEEAAIKLYEMLGNGCRLHKERSQADARDRDLADTGSHDIWNIDTPSCLSCDKSASSSDADLSIK